MGVSRCVGSHICKVNNAFYCKIFHCDFFFQAEDGIRDRTVTGVQTCALPIFLMQRYFSLSTSPLTNQRCIRMTMPTGGSMVSTRSEERRVGKECRSLSRPDK